MTNITLGLIAILIGIGLLGYIITEINKPTHQEKDSKEPWDY